MNLRLANNRRELILFLVALLGLVLIIGLTLYELRRLGQWHLSATNSENGLLVEVFLDQQREPYYSTRLVGHALPQDVVRLTREQLPAEVGDTTFYDETTLPGRWTLILDGVELDVMESRLVVDGDQVMTPRD